VIEFSIKIMPERKPSASDRILPQNRGFSAEAKIISDSLTPNESELTILSHYIGPQAAEIVRGYLQKTGEWHQLPPPKIP
jgi:hypothetical protein